MRQTFPGAVRSVGEREFRFCAVSPKLGRDGHILEPSGVDLSEYRKVPVVLWQHIATSPVARCSSIALVDGEVRGTAEFAPAATSAAVDEAFGCVKSGVVGAVSVGFDIIDAEPLDPKKGSRGGLHIKRSTLLEISLVSIPADVGALITQRGYRSNAMQKHLAKLEEFVDTAARHHDDLGRAMDRGDEFGADRAHVKLGRCIRDCQRCFRDIHAQAALDDLKANQFAQNSDGMGRASRAAAAPITITAGARPGSSNCPQSPHRQPNARSGCASSRPSRRCGTAARSSIGPKRRPSSCKPTR
jgi:HK97 family phage prohead protease